MCPDKGGGFSGSSAGKEYTCNAGDCWVGKMPWKGIGNSHQYSWVALVAQMVKNLSAVQETWVQSLGLEDLLEEGIAIHSSILAWRIPMDSGAWQSPVNVVTKIWT